MRQLITQATFAPASGKAASLEALVRVREIRGSEGLSERFHFVAELEAPAPVPVPFDELLGKPAALRLSVFSGPDRYFHGIVSRIVRRVRRRIGVPHNTVIYQVHLLPKIELLDRSVQTRVFQDQTVEAILRGLLQNYNAEFELKAKYDPRPYCVQYRESDLAFISRLMEEEGIFYFFRHSADKHQMIVADSPGAFSAIEEVAPLRFGRDRSINWLADRVWDWAVTQEVRAGKATLGAMHFQQCDVNPAGSAELAEGVKCGRKQYLFAVGGNKDLEVYGYPARTAKLYDNIDAHGQPAGKDASKTQAATTGRAQLEMERQALAGFQVRCAGFCPYLRPGGFFDLADHGPGDGSYYVRRVEHSLGSREGHFVYENHFAAQPKAMPFRPPLVTPRPAIPGVLTAMVTGPKKSDVFADPFGRVRVQFYWDRTGATGLTSESGAPLAGSNYWSNRPSGPETSSAWLRVSQPWAGDSHGRIVVPRVGMEVAVGFLDSDPDQPYVLGTLYNSVNPPPFNLPDGATSSGLKTHTAGGDNGTFSGLAFEDRSRGERVHLHSQAHLGLNAYRNHVVNVAGQHTTNANSIYSMEGTLGLPVGGSGGGGASGLNLFNWTVGNVTAEIGNSAKLYYGQYIKAICGLYGRFICGSKIDLIIDPFICLGEVLAPLWSSLASFMMLPSGINPLGRNEIFLGNKLEYVYMEKSSVIMGAKFDVDLSKAEFAAFLKPLQVMCLALAALIWAQFLLYGVSGGSYPEWVDYALEYVPFALAFIMIITAAWAVKKVVGAKKMAELAKVAVLARSTSTFTKAMSATTGVLALK